MFYPLMIDLNNKKVVLIGGGYVSLRKSKKFLEYGAKVYVVAPSFQEDFCLLKEAYAEKLHLIKDNYKSEYIVDAFLVVASTDSKEVNSKIASFCVEKNILCNVVDDIEESSCIVPSTVKRGELLISVSTLGNSPSLCGKIRKELEETYDEQYEEYVKLLGEVRKHILESCNDNKEKKIILNNLVNLNLKELREFYKELKKSL
ncbi:precorrin-2 dehydrogenase/sirohydrochlorin ferrochelatase family protein [Haloimpatiens lingqiaonensis]|uniref:precorrin-2 dehydrogenase/sirohydrochlorin ferrochelatase family protein n=1 Tax=Haloimpatiens lingqiaonensis TaxID=1380675 RepID=UPI0010FF3E2B|nr:bifunctional precorrin-2 dehydrogenase/sirohydrochlorin ferrochelatase [Haloimpatiens lingqiaonensis]